MTVAEALLGKIIDYAGIFPPAQLDLQAALRNFLGYQKEADAWLLGRFVCPAARLDELAALLGEPHGGAKDSGVTVLGRGAHTEGEYLAHIDRDEADILRFNKTTGLTPLSYEVRLPISVFRPIRPTQLSSLIGATLTKIHGQVKYANGFTCFFEAPLGDRPSALALVQGLRNQNHSSSSERTGFKQRTGGVESATFPSGSQIALVLAACASARVPFKATAGLHHPLPRFDPDLKVKMHGFVNVFTAGCLGLCHRLDEGRIRAILEDDDPSHFGIGPVGLRWQDLTATAAQVAEARNLFTSFGSCDFDQPRKDLRELGWL